MVGDMGLGALSMGRVGVSNYAVKNTLANKTVVEACVSMPWSISMNAADAAR